MGAPKSVTKIKTKNGKSSVEFTDFTDQANYYLFELTRAALRDVGKYVKKEFQNNYYQHFKKHTGEGGKATNFKVLSSKSTQYPRVQIGLKSGKTDGFYAYFQEFGSSRTPRLGLLQKTVKNNVAQIVQIESQYLSGLSDEAERLNSQIDEGDYEEDD